MIELTKDEIKLLQRLEKSEMETVDEILRDIGCDPSAFFNEDETQREFQAGDQVFHISYGHGIITGITTAIVNGIEIEVYVYRSENNKINVQIPIVKMESAGVRIGHDHPKLKEAYIILFHRRIRKTAGRARIRKIEGALFSKNLIKVAEAIVTFDSLRYKLELSKDELLLFNSGLDNLVGLVSRYDARDPSVILKELKTILNNRVKRFV